MIFTGIYYAADGTNVQDKPYIYSAIDYGDHLGRALLYIFLIVLIFLPLLHILVYAVCGTRQWLVKKICKSESENEGISETL